MSTGAAGTPRFRPSPKGLRPSECSFRGIVIGRRPASRRARWAHGGHTSGLRPYAWGEARRETCEAHPIRHSSCRDIFPAGEGCFMVRDRGGGRPCGCSASHGLRHPPWLRNEVFFCGRRQLMHPPAMRHLEYQRRSHPVSLLQGPHPVRNEGVHHAAWPTFGSFPRAGTNSFPPPRRHKEPSHPHKRKKPPLARTLGKEALRGTALATNKSAGQALLRLTGAMRYGLTSSDESGSSNQKVVPPSPLSTP